MESAALEDIDLKRKMKSMETEEREVVLESEPGFGYKAFAPYSYSQICDWLKVSINILKDVSCKTLSRESKQVLMSDVDSRLNLLLHALTDTKDRLEGLEFRIYES